MMKKNIKGLLLNQDATIKQKLLVISYLTKKRRNILYYLTKKLYF